MTAASTLAERLRAEAADMGDVEQGPWPPMVKQAFRDVSALLREAAAELTRLEGEVERLRELAAFNKRGWDGAFLQACENGAKCNEFRQDAERMDWLENPKPTHWVRIERQSDGRVLYTGNKGPLRAAIDAARTPQEGGNAGQ